MNEATATPGAGDRQELLREHGPWSAMAIHLGDGEYTREPPTPDFRLRRLLRIARDVVGRPLSGLRVLDLACLEGHYAIEFARQGAHATGIEVREAHLAKARYAARRLGLDVEWRREDVRALSRATHGTFDIVICSGILYHLDAADVFAFMRRIREVCTRVAIIDTHVALRVDTSVAHEGHDYHGLRYVEHDADADAATRERAGWSSIDNRSSFWPTEPSLLNLMARCGFTSCYAAHVPEIPALPLDRRTYVAIAGEELQVLTSPITEASAAPAVPERRPDLVHPVQRHPLRRRLAGLIPGPLARAAAAAARRLRRTPRA